MIHSYPWYVADWKNGETRMRLSLAERAVFRELLDHCWMNGSIPADEKMMAKICGCDSGEFKKAWKNVKDSFIEQDGRLTHHRVVSGRGKLIAWNDARREAGKKGGIGKSVAKAKNEAIAKVEPKPSTSTSTSVPKTPPPARDASRKPDFEPFDVGPDSAQLVSAAVEECASFWPKVGNKTYAKSAWEKHASTDPNGAAYWCKNIVPTAKAHAEAHMDCIRSNPRHFIPTLERWVVEGDYTSPAPRLLTRGGKTMNLEMPEGD